MNDQITVTTYTVPEDNKLLLPLNDTTKFAKIYPVSLFLKAYALVLSPDVSVPFCTVHYTIHNTRGHVF